MTRDPRQKSVVQKFGRAATKPALLGHDSVALRASFERLPKSAFIPDIRRSQNKLTALALLLVIPIIILSFSVFVEAGSGPIEHYCAARTSEQAETSAGATVLTGTAGCGTTASANGWVDSSNLTPGDDYLIMVWGEHDTSNTAGRSGLEVTHGSTIFTESQSIEETDRTNDDLKMPYFWFTVWTAVADEDLEVHIRNNNASHTARAEDVTMLVMNAENLVDSGDLQYDIQDPVASSLTTSYVSKASITWTPDNADDSWWLGGYVQGSTATTSGSLEFQFDIDNGTARSNGSIQGEDTADTPNRAVGWAQTFSAAEHTVELELRDQNGNQDWEAAALFALRLDRFEDFIISTADSSAISGLNTLPLNYEIDTLAPNPTTEGNWLVAAGGIADDNNGGLQCQIANSGTAITDLTGGWSHDNDDLVPLALGDVLNLTTGLKGFEYDCQNSVNSVSSSVEDLWMVAFSMEEPTSTTDVQQTHFRWRDDSTALDTDGGWLAAEDTNIVDADKLTTYRIRIEAANNSSSVAANHFRYRLEYAPKSGTCGASTGWARIDTGSDEFEMVDTTHFTNEESLDTSRLTASEATFVAGDGNDTDDTSSSTSLAVDEYTEMEYSIRPTDDAISGKTYCFRLMNTSKELDTYSVYPEMTIVETDGGVHVTQEDYVFENDDQDGATDATLQAGSLFSSPKTLDDIRQGERTNVRVHVKNTSNQPAISSNQFSLFYDRNDGIWTKVGAHDLVSSDPGTGEDCAGFDDSAGSTDFFCETILDGNDAVEFLLTGDIAITPDGSIYVAFGTNNEGPNTTGNNLNIARYVGSGGDCDGFVDTGGSDAWECTVVIDSDDGGFLHNSLEISPAGFPAIATYRTESGTFDKELIYAEYVGSGGNCDGFDDTGGSDAWQCTEVIEGDHDDDMYNLDLIFTPDGVPIISTTNYEATPDETDVVVAEYVGGSSGSCSGFDDTGGSNAWDCTTVIDGDDTEDFRGYTSLAMTPNGEPMLITNNNNENLNTTGDNLVFAERRASGFDGNCDGFDDTGGSDAWDCTTVIDGNSTQDYGSLTSSSLAVNPEGIPYIVSYSYNETLNTQGSNLVVATLRTSGSNGNCDGFDDTGGSDAWDCTVVIDGDNAEDFRQQSSIVFDPSGAAVILSTNYNESLNTQGSNLLLVREVGSGGSCDGFDDTGGSDAWDCENLIDGDTADDYEDNTSLAIDSRGNIYGLATNYNESLNTQGNNLVVFNTNRAGEILAAPSQILDHEASLTESHADMTSESDTSNRDSADCISGSSWNNGSYTSAENVSNITLPAGDSTSQCTELMWTIDTSQATVGTTYRFVVASNDAWNAGRGMWRGPIQIDEYPQITVRPAIDQEIRYSKDLLQFHTDCETYGESGGSTEWGCSEIIDSGSSSDFQGQSYIEFGDNGEAFFVINNDDGGSNKQIAVGEYVGSGGNCDGYIGAGGSDAWQCTDIIDLDNTTAINKTLAVAPSGVPHVVARGGETYDIVLAYEVGSGGNCDGFIGSGGSDAWQCEVIIDGDSSEDFLYEATSIAFTPSGVPYIATYDHDGSHNNLIVAKYVGSGGNCDGFIGTGGSDAWECTKVIDGEHNQDFEGYVKLAITDEGTPYIVTNNIEELLEPDLVFVEYVESGGNCDGFDGTGGSDAWQCTTVINGDTVNDFLGEASLSIDPNGVPYIAATDYNASLNTSGNNLIEAHYVGGGTGNCAGFVDTGGSNDWQCTVVVDGDSTSDYLTDVLLAHDTDGNATIVTENRETNTELFSARYVGSGGNCDGFDDSGGSDAWQCDTIVVGDDTTDFSDGTDMSFSPSGVPYVLTSNHDGGTYDLVLAQLNLPDAKLSNNNTNRHTKDNALSGDYRYRLNSGRSNYDETGFNCTGNSLYTGYCGLLGDNGDYDSLVASNADELPIYGMAMKFDANTTVPSAQWIGNTNLAPSTATPAASSGDIVMEVYRFGTTNAWEEVARDSTSTNCSSDNCVLNGLPSGTVSEYFETIDGKYWIYFRVYQETNGSTAITFKVDAFRAQQQSSALRHGGFFREGQEAPLNQRR